MEEYVIETQINEPIIKHYAYGSRVYGVVNNKSDFDFVTIVKSDDADLKYSAIVNDMNFSVYSEQRFIKEIERHNISVLECIFQDDNDEYRQYFELNLDTLRRSISAVCSNSFVKCKKKLAIGEDYTGKKSLFHSIRILMYGIQIASTEKIYDYQCANFYYKDIVLEATRPWDYYKDTYTPIANSMRSKFRILAPLESEINSD